MDRGELEKHEKYSKKRQEGIKNSKTTTLDRKAQILNQAN